MSNTENKGQFINGCSIKKHTTKYGDIIKLSGKTDEFIKSISAITKGSGWFNVEIKTNKDGKFYMVEDTWQPTGGFQTAASPQTTQSTPERRVSQTFGAGDSGLPF